MGQVQRLDGEQARAGLRIALGQGLDGIIENLARTRGGTLHVNPGDFTGFGMGARFYPMLYLLALAAAIAHSFTMPTEFVEKDCWVVELLRSPFRPS